MYCHPLCENRDENYPHSEAQEFCVICGGVGVVCCPDDGFECGSGLDEATNDACVSCAGTGQAACPAGCAAAA